MASSSTSTELRNIILVGPGGSLGSVLLEGLLSEPTFTVSVLVRESSKSLKILPGNVNVHKIPDDYPKEQLVEAFRGQDAVVNAMTGGAVAEQYRFIDAAIEAGVKRYVPSEYGLNNRRPEARALNAVFDGKGKVQEYLESKESTGLTWHAIGCGMWIDWSLKNNFLGIDYTDRTVTFYDDGKGKFSTSTMANTALALNRSLLNSAATKNQTLFISDFATSQNDLVQAFERVSGEKWTVKSVGSKKALADATKKVEEGDPYAVYKQIEIGFTSGKHGAWLEEKEKIWNEELGLPKQDKNEVVREALASMASQLCVIAK